MTVSPTTNSAVEHNCSPFVFACINVYIIKALCIPTHVHAMLEPHISVAPHRLIDHGLVDWPC